MTNSLLVSRPVRRKPSARVDADPKIPAGQPTWCVRITKPCAFPLPAGRNDDGSPAFVPAGQQVRLHCVGTDDQARAVWEVPADDWWAGDTIRIGPTPDDVVVRYGVHPPNTTAHYWRTYSARSAA